MKNFNLSLMFGNYSIITRNNKTKYPEKFIKWNTGYPHTEREEKIMMKKALAAAAFSAVVIGLFTGCSGADIGQEKAKEAAFSDAGVTESEISRLKVSKDRDDGRSIYEVDFMVTETGEEYDYEILASDGSVVKVDKDAGNLIQNQNSGQDLQSQIATLQKQLDELNKQAASAGTENQDDLQKQIQDLQKQVDQLGQSGQSQQNSGSQTVNQANVAISLEEAGNLALERVPGATQNDLKIKLDYDDGVYKYEGDIIYERKEYEFEIDANTGTFLEWSEERR